MSDSVRCAWSTSEPIYVAYHDEEWGVPERDSRALWEKLVLDGFQAGLSWITILKKREAFRKAFDNFDPDIVARYGEKEKARLLADAGIIRSRAKIEAAIKGARVWLDMREGGVDFAPFVWSFVDGVPVQNRWDGHKQIPTQTPVSQEMSKALRARGFNFVGPVIVYAFMQATGLVNDHVVSCHRYAPIKRLGEAA